MDANNGESSEDAPFRRDRNEGRVKSRPRFSNCSFLFFPSSSLTRGVKSRLCVACQSDSGQVHLSKRSCNANGFERPIMVFCQLQLGESIVRQRWQDWFEDAVRQAEEVRWLYYRTRIKQEKELLLLLDQPMLEQRRWIDIKHESSPADVRRVQTRSFCSCESQYEVRDLGDDHYPRYLTVSYCKPKTCQNKFHPCKILYYMVHILRPRETNVPSKWFSGDDEIPETPLPEFLKRKWQLKPVSVPVACVPA